ncbi:5'-methylthioadenosine/S-adenosylhomocysteine nucleosidase family protein [Nocardia aurantiaca]|uniref:Uncharacterized protein n=1 Tax=Nocardia aurantiaca TaxID=2675850 RepID=A0A6I3KSE3_9NOCA|nr:hypothetical protein [Nocardia aurantiaca]MTE13673.1 hypothetical protein [Nocardia aurantiaca]
MPLPFPSESAPIIDTVILAALELERAAVVRALGEYVEYPWRGRKLQMGTIGDRRILVVPLDGMGNVNSAYVAQRAIGIWNPAQVLLVGIAGGARAGAGDLALGDVLVPEQVVGYELAKVTPTGAVPRYEVYRPDQELLAVARGVAADDWTTGIRIARPDDSLAVPCARFGPVLCGEKVVADETFLASLQTSWPKAIGIEMEALGVALAAYRGGPGFLMVKAVCDFAGEDKDDLWQRYAADAAARFAVAVLHAFSAPGAAGQRVQAKPLGAVNTFPGTVKLVVCQRLLDDWEKVADYFDVPPHNRAPFRHGRQARDLWVWLEIRDKLHELPDALTVIGRADLAEILRDSQA